MIVRVFRVVVHDGKQETFKRFFLETALPLMRQQAGLVSVTPGLPRWETPDEFCMVMIWRDIEALKAFAGEDWQHPHIHPDEAGIVRKRYLHHYELATA